MARHEGTAPERIIVITVLDAAGDPIFVTCVARVGINKGRSGAPDLLASEARAVVERLGAERGGAGYRLDSWVRDEREAYVRYA